MSLLSYWRKQRRIRATFKMQGITIRLDPGQDEDSITIVNAVLKKTPSSFVHGGKLITVTKVSFK